MMKGAVLDFNRSSGEGLIRGDDGTRYAFSATDFKSEAAPKPGQTVDFEVKDGRATAIYALATKGMTIDMNDAAQRISAFAKEAKVDATAKKVLENLKGGPKDRIGVGLSAAAILCLFLPFLHVPFLGSVSLIETAWGKLLFVIALGLAFLCYQGMDRKWVKVAACAFAAVALINSWAIIADLSSVDNLTNAFMGASRNRRSFLELLAFGFYATLVSTALLMASAFLRKKAHTTQA